MSKGKTVSKEKIVRKSRMTSKGRLRAVSPSQKSDMEYIQRKSKEYLIPRDFAKDFTQEGTRDTSNYEDRFGRLFYNNDSLDKLEKDQRFRENLSYHSESKKYFRIIDNDSNSIMIYRAVPRKASNEIQLGDWVTLDKQYAEEHAKRSLSNGKFVSKRVSKKDIISESRDISEWIYSPQVIRKEYKSLEEIWFKNATPKRRAIANEVERQRARQLALEQEERRRESIESEKLFKRVNRIYEKSKKEKNDIKRLELLIESQDRLRGSSVDPHKKNKLLRVIANDKVQIKRKLRSKGYIAKDFDDIEDRVFVRLDQEN